MDVGGSHSAMIAAMAGPSDGLADSGEMLVLGGREEGLADDRVLEDVEQVGGVPPELVGGSPGDLRAELPPRGGSV